MIGPIAAVLALTSTPSVAQEAPAPRRFPAQRFAVAAPGEGWAVRDGVDTEAGFRVDLPLAASGGLVAASVLAGPTSDGVDSTRARDRAIESFDERPEYRAHSLLDDLQLDGRASSGVDVVWETRVSGTFVIRQRYLVAYGRTYLLQAHAPKDDWVQYDDPIGRFFGSFRLIEPSEDEQGIDTVRALAARCGSEIDWAADWEQAARRARAEGRYVLAVVRSYPGFDIPDTTRLVTLMNEDVIKLVRSRLVPVRLTASSPSPLRDPEVYGLSPSTFGVAFILLDADGEVIADTPHTEPAALLMWLMSELGRNPAHSPERPADPLEAARFALDRGELDLAEKALDRAPAERAATHVERARLQRLRRDGSSALEELFAARLADPDLSDDVACDAAMLMIYGGELEEAKEVLSQVLQVEDSPHVPEAMLVMSFLHEMEGGIDDGRAMRERLVRDHPDSRWAWLAAAYIQLEPLRKLADSELDVRWPRPEVLELMAEPPSAPLPASAARRAEADAVAWLLSHQRDDGSWPTPTELQRKDEDAPDHIATAIDALATRALLQRGERYRQPALRGLAFLLEADARRRADPPPVVYMDYTAWSTWAQLELIVDAMEAEVGDDEELRAWGGSLVADLASRVRRNGGWSYYVSGDAAGEDTVEQSISFTTAAAAIGLVRARDAGITTPDALVDGALDCLEAMRGDDGLFAYMIHHPGGAQTRSAAPGAAGRGPACELALRLGGRGEPARVRGALDLFEANAGALAAEVGKALMHAGADTQGCHYPFFDYLMAARAAASLSARDRAEHRARMLDIVLAARLADGSFQDTPIIGPTFGTAAALLTIHALRP